VMYLTGPDYFRTMKIPLLRGRYFTAADTTQSPCVMIIDTVFAHTYFSDSDPLLHTLSAGFSPMGPCRIVGVVGHVRHWVLEDPGTYTQVQAYLSLYQDPDKWVPVNYPGTTIVLRTPLDLETVMPAIKGAVYGGESDQTIYDVRTMQEIVSESMSSQQFTMILLSAFAGLALLLASIGVYGVLSYSVAQRTHEIGIRMTLGAEKRSVFRMVIAQGLPTGAGRSRHRRNSCTDPHTRAFKLLASALRSRSGRSLNVSCCIARLDRSSCLCLLHPGAARDVRRPNHRTAL